MCQLRQNYGDIYRLYVGKHLVVFLTSNELINEAFLTQSENFSTRPNWLLPGLRRNGIVWSNGEISQTLRRLALKSFREFGLGKKSLEDRIIDEAGFVNEVLAQSNQRELNTESILRKAIENLIHSLVFVARLDYNNPKFNELMSDIDTFSNFHPLQILPDTTSS